MSKRKKVGSFRERVKSDQYFTPSNLACNVARLCRQLSDRVGGSFLFIEPSAGEGAFVDALQKHALRTRDKLISVELDAELAPKTNAVCADFLHWSALWPCPSPKHRRQAMVVGNPPYQVKGVRYGAVAFINAAARIADTVVFVLPPCVRRPSVEAKIDASLRLVVDKDLGDVKFVTSDGRTKSIRVRLQAWQRKEPGVPRSRIRASVSFAEMRHCELFEIRYTCRKLIRRKLVEEKSDRMPDMLVMSWGSFQKPGKNFPLRHVGISSITDPGEIEARVTQMSEARGNGVTEFLIYLKPPATVDLVTRLIESKQNAIIEYVNSVSSVQSYHMAAGEFIAFVGEKPHWLLRATVEDSLQCVESS